MKFKTQLSFITHINEHISATMLHPHCKSHSTKKTHHREDHSQSDIGKFPGSRSSPPPPPTTANNPGSVTATHQIFCPGPSIHTQLLDPKRRSRGVPKNKERYAEGDLPLERVRVILRGRERENLKQKQSSQVKPEPTPT